MPWFYYKGRTVKPIPIRKGLSLAVRPHTKVEIEEPSINEVKILIRQRLLTPTAPPRIVPKITDEPAADVAKVTARSEMATRIAERGEITDGEANSPVVNKPEDRKVKVVAPVDEPEEEAEIKVEVEEPIVSFEDVEVLSSVERSPEKSGDKKKNKKSRKK